MRAITTALLNNVGTIIRTKFLEGQNDVEKKVPIFWQKIAELVPSTDLKEVYGRMAGLPGFRKWVGAREIQRMQAGDYTVFNDRYELTVALTRDDLEFDKIGLRAWMATQQGTRARQLPDTLVWAAMNAGFDTDGPDGQKFFDTDHPLVTVDGGATIASNYEGGSGLGWFITAALPGMKPIMLQEVIKPNLVEMFDPANPHVFMNKEYVWGSDCMYGAGYFMWPLIQASKKDLDDNNFNEAYDHFTARLLDGGVKQALLPTDLWVPSSLRSAGERVVKAINRANGETNTNFGKCELNVIPYLTNS